jgi:hypothetical protein
VHRAERGGSCGGGAREVESQVHARLRSDLRLGRGGPEVQLLAPAERVAHEGRGGVEPEWQPGHVHAVSAAGRERARRERSAAALLAAPRRAERGSAGRHAPERSGDVHVQHGGLELRIPLHVPSELVCQRQPRRGEPRSRGQRARVRC